VGKNQQRWKNWVDDRIRGVLEEAAKDLEWAWKRDKELSRSYPLNTWYQFVQIEEQLQNQPKVHKSIKLPPPPPPPKRLSELVDERTIRAVYEQQNDGTYQEALKLAASEDGKASSAWRKLLHAVDAAYFIDRYGDQAAPRPRLQFLHRELLKIAALADLNDLSHQGIVEFLDDLCPCGKKHKSDAIRKLRQRLSRPGGAKP
jgi:hypothetical protein